MGTSDHAAGAQAGLGGSGFSTGLSHWQGTQAEVVGAAQDAGSERVFSAVGRGGVVQADSISSADKMRVRQCIRDAAGMFEGGMWIFYLEMLVVLGLAIFIVWWTLPGKKSPPANQPGRTEANKAETSDKRSGPP